MGNQTIINEQYENFEEDYIKAIKQGNVRKLFYTISYAQEPTVTTGEDNNDIQAIAITPQIAFTGVSTDDKNKESEKAVYHYLHQKVFPKMIVVSQEEVDAVWANIEGKEQDTEGASELEKIIRLVQNVFPTCVMIRGATTVGGETKVYTVRS